MKKSLFRMAMTLFIAAATVAVLFACAPSGGESEMIGLAVLKNGQAVTEISFTEGETIDYEAYTLLVTLSDGNSFTDAMTEATFSKPELDALYALKGGGAKTMNLFYLKDGKTVQGILVVNVLVPVVEKETFTLSFSLTGEYSAYRFDPIPNLTRVTSLPETHPELPAYFKITWCRTPGDISTRLDLPYELVSDLTVYGTVRDDRTYTVRFWKDKTADGFKNQIGSDVSGLHPGDRVDAPKEGIDKVGYTFLSWWKYDAASGTDKELDVYGAIGEKYFLINRGEPCDTYPAVQIINVYARYAVRTFTLSLYYVDDQGMLNDLKLDGSASAFSVNYGTVLRVGAEFSRTETELVLPPAPPVLGDAYRGSWYVNDTVFGADQTRTVQDNVSVVAKYEKKRQVVRFFGENGRELKSMSVDYGTIVSPSDYPAHSTETGYDFDWDNGQALLNPVTADLDVREVKTPRLYSYVFYLETAGGRVLYENDASPFNGRFALWDADAVRTALGADYKPYFDYGWYASETANPETDAPLIGAAAQVAGRMSFYLKKRDMRRYTVDYYAEMGEGGAVSSEKTATVTVGYAASASYRSDPVPGWRADSLYDKNDPDRRLSSDLSFVPSSFAAESDAREYRIEVVVRYVRETYAVRLSEKFGTEQSVYQTVEGVPYETKITELPAILNYGTADRAQNGETYRFYGWFDAGGKPVAPTSIVASDVDLYAYWVALSEGTLGIKYEVKNAGGASYAAAVGYDGAATELIVGSKYVLDGAAYPVEEIGWIAVAGKNSTVSKITIPSSVKAVTPGAFVDFYAVAEYEAAAGSSYLKTADGVLFSADGLKIVAYPIKKAGNYAVPDAVAAIGNSAFLGYPGSSVTFGTSSALTELGDNAFANASELVSVALPSGLRNIGRSAFSGARKLNTVTYAGNALSDVGEDAFAGTPFLRNAPDGILTLGAVLVSASGNLPKDFVLGDGIVSIASGAFADTEIETFTVGADSSLRFVGAGAFAKCQKLNAFFVRKTSALIDFDLDNYAFNDVETGFAIRVPAAKYREYLSTYAGTAYADDFVSL